MDGLELDHKTVDEQLADAPKRDPKPQRRRPKKGSGRPSGYRLADGTKVPGTTTILSRFKDSGGLIRWAHTMGVEGKSLDEARDSAASVGTCVHDAVEQFILGDEDAHLLIQSRDELDEQQKAQAGRGFAAFVEWWETYQPIIHETEVAFVHEDLKYGGTLDAIGEIRGRVVLIDWKTSNSVYHDYLVQLAAYDMLHEKVRGSAFEAFHLLRFSKNTANFTHHHYRDLGPARKLFRALRAAYEYDRQVRDLMR